MGEIVTVNFRGDDLYGFKQDDGMFLAVKPMCEAMGLGWEAQRQRLARDPVLSKGTSVMKVPFGRGGAQEAVCIKLELVNGFLFSIDSSRIKDEVVRERVILYQEECYAVLHSHFAGKRSGLMASNDDDGEPSDKISTNERRSLVAEVRQTFDRLAARQLYFKLGLPRVDAMYAEGANDPQGTLFHAGMVRRPESEAA